MPEEPAGILGGHGLQRPTHRADQRFAGARLGSSQEPLDLREGLLDRIEVRRVGRQVDELAASTLDDLLHPTSLVGR